MSDPIKEIKLPSGKKRYRFVLDIGRRPDGGRRQLTVTKDTRKEAKAEYARLVNEKNSGTLIVPNKITLNEWIDQWLALKAEDLEVTTMNSYMTTLKPVRARLGHIPLQQLTEEQVVDFVKWMLAEGRVRHRPGTGLSTTTVDMALGRLKELLNRAVTKKLVRINVASEVSIPRKARKAERKAKIDVPPWNVEEVRTFVAGILDERFYAPLLLSLLGLRPAEVCGLRWEHIDLDARTLQVASTRTLMNNSIVVEKDTKSQASDRGLPLPAPLWEALRKYRAVQAAEKLAAGADYVDSGYVLVDEIGVALNGKHLRKAAYRLMGKLGMRQVRLYDARASCLTYLANQGVPEHILARWAGHTNPKTTRKYYVKPDVEDLRGAAATWEGLHGVPTQQRENL